MEETMLGFAFQYVAGDALNRGGAPIRAHIRKHLRAVGEQMAEEHGCTIERIVFGGDDERLANAVPVKRRTKHRFHEIAVGIVIGPLSLPLESGGDGIVAASLFGELLLEFLVSDHKIARDDRHLETGFPILIFLFSRSLFLGIVRVFTFFAIRFY